MGFRDDLLDVLAGGLPALADGPNRGATTMPVGGGEGSPISPVRVEEIPPSGTFQDREPFRFLQSGISQPILLGTAGLITLLAVFMIARR